MVPPLLARCGMGRFSETCQSPPKFPWSRQSSACGRPSLERKGLWPRQSPSSAKLRRRKDIAVSQEHVSFFLAILLITICYILYIVYIYIMGYAMQ